jgi:hypothetical protein
MRNKWIEQEMDEVAFFHRHPAKAMVTVFPCSLSRKARKTAPISVTEYDDNDGFKYVIRQPRSGETLPCTMFKNNDDANRITAEMNARSLSYRDIGRLYGYPESATRFFEYMDDSIREYLEGHQDEGLDSINVYKLYNSLDRVSCCYGGLNFITSMDLVDTAREELESMYGEDGYDEEFSWRPFILREE